MLFPVGRIADTSIDPRSREFLVAAHYGLFQTRLGVREWKRTLGGYFNVLVEDPGDYDTLYLGARYAALNGASANLLKSTDGGLTWRDLTAGLLDYESTLDVTSVAVDPSQSSTLYAGTPKGMFKSEDGGEDWRLVHNGLLAGPLCWSDGVAIYRSASITSLAIDPFAPEVLYAAASFSGQLLKSVDGGEQPRTTLLRETTASTPSMLSMGDDRLDRLETTVANLEDAGELYITEGASIPGATMHVFLFNADTSNEASVMLEWHCPQES